MLLTFVPESMIWMVLAFVTGTIVSLWVSAFIRGYIFAWIGISITMLPLNILALLIWRFLAIEPPLTESIAFHWIVFGVIMGVVAHYVAIFWIALEEVVKERTENK